MRSATISVSRTRTWRRSRLSLGRARPVILGRSAKRAGEGDDTDAQSESGVARTPAGESQGVEDHAYAGESHRGPGHDRAQITQRGERKPKHVVGEGPEQAALDRPHGAARQVDDGRHEAQ